MLYHNRDLSWLGFNERILMEAANKDVPLFERLKFLSIFSSNLDEFFSVRYPVVLAIGQLKTKTQKKIDKDRSENIVDKIQLTIERQLEEYGRILEQELLPNLQENGIVLYYNSSIRPEHKDEVREIFLSTILSFVQPVFLDANSENKFSPESNQLYMIISLKKADHKELQHTIIKVPSDTLKRFYVLSPLEDKEYIIFIDDIIRENIHCIFPGFEISATYSIKFNRDSEVDLDEEYSGDILKKIEKKLHKRAKAPLSRFLYQSNMPRNVQLFVASYFKIDYEEMFAGNKYHNLKDLIKLPDFNKRLAYEKRKPLMAVKLNECGDIFRTMEERDILLHLPYQSYNPILTFFNQAAVDPEVDEIFITLYRVAENSLIVNALISAACNGKKVTAFVELKARFDEANNINWSRKMQDAGIKIIYSIPGIKVHSKIALVTKGKHANKKTYALLSTGNFNELTANFYTDHTLLTCNTAINTELHTLFQFLQKRERPTQTETIKFNTLLVSHFNMTEQFENLIDQEVKKAKKGLPALIRIKLNNLEEPKMIGLLYKASQAGVQIQLIARSICSLIPSSPGVSEHIKVKRIVDRYLEHSRIFIFGSDENNTCVFIGSSDWMTRNLHYRIEVCTPVYDSDCKKQLIDYFDLQWRDNDKAVLITENTEQQFITAQEEKVNAQSAIYNYLQQRL